MPDIEVRETSDIPIPNSESAAGIGIPGLPSDDIPIPNSESATGIRIPGLPSDDIPIPIPESAAGTKISRQTSDITLLTSLITNPLVSPKATGITQRTGG